MNKINLLLLLTSLFPGLSHATDSSFYGGLANGAANYEGNVNEDVLLAPGQRLNDDTNFVEVYTGYSINEYISFEIGYADFGVVNETYKLNPDVISIVSPNNKEEIDLTRIRVGGVIEYPAYKNFSVIGLFGYSYFNLDRKFSGGFNLDSGDIISELKEDSEEGIYYGVGFKYLFNSKLSARFQWVHDSPGSIDLNSSNLSLEMKF